MKGALSGSRRNDDGSSCPADATITSPWRAVFEAQRLTITRFELSERQARFLNIVMLHSGVFVGRQYATFAGITHGQKVHDF